MRGLVWLAGVALVTSGCGGGEAAETRAASPTSSASASPEVVERTLAETCPMVEQIAPTGSRVGLTEIQDFTVQLARMSSEGDIETQNALEPLRVATGKLADVAIMGENQGPAWAKYDAAIDRVATRCEAVGSGAFQG